jgi:hypothetical protein
MPPRARKIVAAPPHAPLSPTDDVSVSPEADPPPSPYEPAALVVSSLARIETTLSSIERALDAVRGACSVNAELASANVALRAASASYVPSAACAPSASAACAPAPASGSSARVVSFIVSPTDVALVGNEHTFDMRDTLKATGARWTSVPPARWVVSSQAWEDNRAAWESRFGVSFAERAAA